MGNLQQALEGRRVIPFWSALPFWIVHVIATATPFFYPVTWELAALAIGLYWIRMFAITGGYHRYFAHRTYKLGRIPQFLLALLACTSAQKGPLWWAAHHRHHHRHSDKETDLHSPKQDGLFWSHVGWILSEDTGETQWDRIPDFAKYPELVWLNKYYFLPPIFLALTLLVIGGMPAMMWGFMVSTVFLWHGTFFINSLCHVWGNQRYKSKDTSRNNPILAFVTMGEGWHNNHHTYQASCRQGFFWWEFDFTYYIIKALSWVGITHDIKTPPVEKLEKLRITSVSKISEAAEAASAAASTAVNSAAAKASSAARTITDGSSSTAAGA